MFTRRNILASASVIGARIAVPLEALAVGSGFIMLTDNGEHMTNKMPPDETVVEVVLTDGSIQKAFYSQNLMEVGDWDFVLVTGPVIEPPDDLPADSIASLVAGWRPLA
jgi:hypothetical protein